MNPTSEALVLEACRVDLGTGVIRRPGAEAEGLSPLELQLLRYLVAHPREPLSRERLLQEVWGYRPGVVSRSVDTTMARLRARVERSAEQPRHLLSVRGLGYRFEPLDARPAPEVPVDRPIEGTNLTLGPTSFLGRRGELARLAEELERPACLVTVVGPGGIGKTRLARNAALAWVGSGPGREAWFVDLESARDLEGLLSAVARALKLPLLHDRQDPVAQVGATLALRGPVLMVLDNVEQVVEPVRAALRAWRGEAPRVRWLLTSRIRSRLAGELLVDLPPLDLDDAVDLYLARARLVRPDLDPDAAGRAEIASLAEHLDRLPLALELAASRARLMSARAVLNRLDRGLAVIDGTQRGRSERQATLHATLAWSWDLLGPAPRAALVQATVARGGFDLTAAEAILEPGGTGATDPIDALEQLVDHSLVRCVESGGAVRFQLSHSVAAFAEEGADPAVLAAARARHRGHFATLALDWERQLKGAQAQAALAGIQRERENLLAVVEGEDPRATAAAALALAALVQGQGPAALLERLLAAGIEGARAAGDAELEARLLQLRGNHARHLGHPEEARRDFVEARRLVPGMGPSGLAAHLLGGLANLHQDAGEHARADELYLDAIEEARLAGDLAVEALLVGNRAVLRIGEGRLEEARQLGEEALALHREAGNRGSEGNTLYNLAVIELRGRAGPEAERLLNRALEIHLAMEDHLDAARAHVNLSAIAVGKGRLDEAERHARAALSVYRATGAMASMVLVETNLMDILLQSGQAAEAEVLLRGALEEVNRRDETRYRGERRRQRAIVSLNLFLAVADQGRWEEALPLGREAWRLVLAGTAKDMVPYVAGVLGLVTWLSGERGPGLALIHRAVEGARREGQPRTVVVFGSAWLGILGVGTDLGLAAELERIEAGPQAAEARSLLAGRAPSAAAQATSSDLRLLARIREALDEDAVQAGRALRVSADGAWIEAGDERVVVPARGPGRALLRCLVEAHLRGKAVVPWPILHAAGWPEAAPRGGLARLRVAISRLRGLGVDGIEWVDDGDGSGGYGLELGITVQVLA